MATAAKKQVKPAVKASKWTPRRVLLAILAGLITAIVGTLSAWTGTRLLLEAGLAWYESAPIPAVMDLVMIVAAFKINTPGSNPTEKRVARHAMRFGLALSLATNVLSSFMHVTGGLGQAGWTGTMSQFIQVGYSWVPTAMLWLMVEMLTRQNAVAKAPGLVTRLVEAVIKKLTYRPRVTAPKAPKVQVSAEVTQPAPAAPAAKQQVNGTQPLKVLYMPTFETPKALVSRQR